MFAPSVTSRTLIPTCPRGDVTHSQRSAGRTIAYEVIDCFGEKVDNTHKQPIVEWRLRRHGVGERALPPPPEKNKNYKFEQNLGDIRVQFWLNLLRPKGTAASAEGNVCFFFLFVFVFAVNAWRPPIFFFFLDSAFGRRKKKIPFMKTSYTPMLSF